METYVFSSLQIVDRRSDVARAYYDHSRFVPFFQSELDCSCKFIFYYNSVRVGDMCIRQDDI